MYDDDTFKTMNWIAGKATEVMSHNIRKLNLEYHISTLLRLLVLTESYMAGTGLREGLHKRSVLNVNLYNELAR